MTDSPDHPESDPLLEDALNWVILLRTGEPTRDDVDALERWRQQSDAHEEAFRMAARLWRNTRSASQELAAGEASAAQSPPTAIRAQRVVTRRGVIGGALAASVGAAGYLAVRPPFQLWPSLEELAADYRTGKGEQRNVALTDNISLKLNTQTSIIVRSTSNTPAVELISGEVAVTARRDGAAPVAVLAAGGMARAQDADFDVTCLNGTASVSCTRGGAEIELNGHVTRIGQDQRVSYSAQGDLGKVVPIDPVEATAWEKGLLIVRDRPLAEVVDEVNRYRPGLIIVTNGELGRRLVNGTFQIRSLDTFIGQVVQLFGAHATKLPGDIVLLG